MPEKKKPSGDLMLHIKDVHRRVLAKAKEAGLDRYLRQSMSIDLRSHEFGSFHATDVQFDFRPNHGLDHKLTSLVTDEAHSRPISSVKSREELSKAFVAHMRLLLDRAERTAQNRRRIAQLTRGVIEEAAGQGIELELMRIEPAPSHVYREPDPAREPTQVFYVHIMMPHDDEGILTEDTYTVDADEPDEFADYLRRRVLPECVELKQRFAATTQA